MWLVSLECLNNTFIMYCEKNSLHPLIWKKETLNLKKNLREIEYFQ